MIILASVMSSVFRSEKEALEFALFAICYAIALEFYLDIPDKRVYKAWNEYVASIGE